jgi:hypothetical protein
MKQGFVFDDGGRAAAGYKGLAGDCVCRSICVATGLPYTEIYQRISAIEGKSRRTKRSPKGRSASARNGVLTKRKAFKEFMAELGFTWVPTMQIGQGCKVHLDAAELPKGKIICAVSNHYTAMIDGIIHDTFDPRRSGGWQVGMRDGVPFKEWQGGRCVYGYWVAP